AATSHPPGVTAGHTAPSGAPPRHLHLRLCPEALIGLVALLLALWPTASPVPPEPPASLRLHWRVPASLRQLRPRLCITPALLRPSAPSTTSPATRVVALPAAAAERRRTSPKHCQRVKLTTPITLGHLPAGSVEVHLRHPRLASVGRRLHLPAFGQRRLTLRLEPAHQLRLRLVDVAGKAVVGAQVQVHPGDAARERTGQALAWQTESDARGRVRFTQLPAGPLELTVQGRGLQRRRLQRTVARRAKTETLVLAPEARLHGRIYEPSGAPAARVQVAVSGMHLWPPRHTESDAAGRLRLGGLPPGPVQVLAWRGSWVGARDRDLVLQRQHTTRMHLRLEPGRSLVLALRDGRGQPVRGARITVHEAGSGRGRRWARSDARGRAVLAGLRRRPLRLQVQAPGFLPHSRRLDAAQAGRVALTLQRSAALRLRLISPRGHGIADAQVELIPLSAAAAAALPTASIPLPQPSPAPASSLAALASSADNLGTTPAAVPAIPLTPPDGESGTPVSGAGQATPFDSHATAPHFETAAAASSPTTLQVEARRGVSDAQGQVRLHTLAPGRYQLHARQARWLLPKARTLVLRAGAMRKLGDVVLRATGALALKVVDADGRALAGVAVHAAAARYGLHADSRSDARGQLQLAPLLGPVALTLAPPWTMPPLTLTVPAGQRLPHTLRLQHSACILSGRVRGADGQPLGGAHIALQTADGQRHHTQSRPSGHWQLS
ncbi:MAG: carboxypeptidase regulatory-like domain-containing protein, partial [Polyangiales bacterium]